MDADWDDVEAAAKAAAGNHRKFDSFVWYSRPEDDENWCLVYLRSRDSELLTISRASAFEAAMRPFAESDEPDVVSERHNHWGPGWLDGLAIRVYRDGEITAAFRRWCELQAQLADYPCLDEEDVSSREYEATLENIASEGWRFLADGVPEGWEGRVFEALPEEDTSPVDGRGGWPSEAGLKAALFELGLMAPEYVWEVVVGNVGMVARAASEEEARRAFERYCMLSAARSGRASGETVVLLEGGHPVEEKGGDHDVFS